MWIYEQYFIDFLSNNCSSEEENINLKKYFMNYQLIEITVSPRSLDSVKLLTLDMIINQYRRLCLGYPFL